MKKNVPVKSIATTSLMTVHIAQKLSEVRKIIKENDIHHVPVVSGEKLVGLISASDLLSLTFDESHIDERSLDAMLDHQFTIESVMQKDLTTIEASNPIRNAAEILSEGRFHSLPVVNEDGTLYGIVTSTDLIRYLLEQY
ncbi:MAG: CBS domain-containing protein [Bdellovibrionota bacterium]